MAEAAPSAPSLSSSDQPLADNDEAWRKVKIEELLQQPHDPQKWLSKFKGADRMEPKEKTATLKRLRELVDRQTWDTWSKKARYGAHDVDMTLRPVTSQFHFDDLRQREVSPPSAGKLSTLTQEVFISPCDMMKEAERLSKANPGAKIGVLLMGHPATEWREAYHGTRQGGRHTSQEEMFHRMNTHTHNLC